MQDDVSPVRVRPRRPPALLIAGGIFAAVGSVVLFIGLVLLFTYLRERSRT